MSFHAVSLPSNPLPPVEEIIGKKESGKIRVLLADDQPIVRLGVKELLGKEKDIEIVGEATDGRQVLQMIQELNPDILLLELRMPTVDGLTILQNMQLNGSQTRVILFTFAGDRNEFVQAMKFGCSGILPKQGPMQLIANSIRKVHEGEIWLDAATTAAVMKQFASPAERLRASGTKVRERSPLSNREREIVQLVAQGYRNKEMAEKLFISEQTVKNHLHNIFEKLGVADRLELALFAVHNGLHAAGEAPRPS
jgi:DNA-binding NarL/FixJ family response regulator